VDDSLLLPLRNSRREIWKGNSGVGEDPEEDSNVAGSARVVHDSGHRTLHRLHGHRGLRSRGLVVLTRVALPHLRGSNHGRTSLPHLLSRMVREDNLLRSKGTEHGIDYSFPVGSCRCGDGNVVNTEIRNGELL